MAKSKTQKRNVQQHFVTAAYLVGFTPESSRDSQLFVYERNCEKVFRLISEKAAKRRNYYSLPQKDGSFNDIVDTMLTALEGQAMPGLQKLLAGDYELSHFERSARTPDCVSGVPYAVGACIVPENGVAPS